jgi:multidrug resistance efflux pump
MNKTTMSLLAGIVMTASLTGIVGCGAVKPAMLTVQGNASAQSQNVLSYTGKFSGIDEVQIFSKIPGRVAQVAKDVGDMVNPGDVLVTLETTDLESQLESAKANLDLAQAKYNQLANGTREEDIRAAKAAYDAALQKYQDAKNGTRPEQIDQLKAALATAQTAYENAKSKLDSTKALYDQGYVSKQAYDDMQAQFKQAESQYIAAKDNLDLALKGPTQETLNALKAAVDQAKAAYDKAVNGATPQDLEQAKASVESAQAMVNLNQYNLSNGTIKSPIKGYVATKSINAGEMASPSVPLMTIVNMDQMYVSIDVPESELKYIKLNDPVDVQVDALGTTVKGTVKNISPKAEQGSDKYLVKILVDNPDHTLRSGMTGIVKIRTK